MHPTNPNLLLGASNDYQLEFQGATVILQVPSGFFLSQDGGRPGSTASCRSRARSAAATPCPGSTASTTRWSSPASRSCAGSSRRSARGNIHFASSPLSKLTGSADDQITRSDRTIANGNSSDAAAQQIFLDKEWMAIDNNPSSPPGT